MKFDTEEGEAYLLVTALIDQVDRTVSLGVQPQNEALATMSALEDAITDLANPPIPLAVSPASRCALPYRSSKYRMTGSCPVAH